VQEVAGIDDPDRRPVGPDLVREDEHVRIVRVHVLGIDLFLERTEPRREGRLFGSTEPLVPNHEDGILKEGTLQFPDHVGLERSRAIEAEDLRCTGIGKGTDREARRRTHAPTVLRGPAHALRPGRRVVLG
jgi:hypothetical protein